MNKQEAKARIAKLRTEINRHRYLYHVLDKSEISEAASDSLKHELFKLEQQFPDLITPDSPTQRVAGRPLSKFVKVSHSRPVLSLEDVFNFEELKEWLEKNQKLAQGDYDFFCELKLDGLTVVLTYSNGLLVRGATRGNGLIGEDVTQNLQTIESIPLTLETGRLLKGIKLPKIFEVRGEVVITKQVFEKINSANAKSNGQIFANPRNMAAGSIRQLDPKIAAERQLDFMAFEIITDIGQKTHAQVHDILASLGFKISPASQQCQDLEAVKKYLDKWEKARTDLAYQTDGAVVVINSIALQKKLGYIGKTERWMSAYKFPAEQAITVVEDIQVQVGRTGALTPVAHLKPVRLAGTTVSRATLHNWDEVNRLDVRIGDTVIVQKAGDIIPDIVHVLHNLRAGKEKRFLMPKNCPICRSQVAQKAGKVAYYCSNPKCFGQQKERTVHFVSRKAFNIEGLGPKIIEQLINEGLIATPADIFKLKAGDLQPLERFAEKSSIKLAEAIEAAKKIALSRFIFALGIRHVGEETAVDLANKFGTLAKIMPASLEELNAIRDIGGVVAKSIYDFFKDQDNVDLIKDLLALGVKPLAEAKPKSSALAGKTFVLTGGLASMTREEAKELIRKQGGDASESVSKNADYVVAGNEPGSKYDKAKKLGVKIINEKEFIKLLKQAGEAWNKI